MSESRQRQNGTKDFLRTFLIEICEDDQISHSSPVKANIFALLKDWYRKCVSTDEWEYTSQLMGALSRPLNYSEITDENMEEIYGNLFFSCFMETAICVNRRMVF